MDIKNDGGKLLVQFLNPLEVVPPKVMRIYTLLLAAALILIWFALKIPFVPKLGEVLAAFSALWVEGGIFQELLTSFWLNLETLAYGSAIAFTLALLYKVGLVRPLVVFVSKLRFIGFPGLVFVFTVYLGVGHKLKLALLLWSLVGFYVTQMVSVVAKIEDDEYDDAKTLRMKWWRTIWEVIIRGRLSDALEMMRQNAALGWAMLTAVEGLSKSEGGIGVMILNNDKYLKLEAIFAMMALILLTGIFQDYLFRVIRKAVCPYAYIRAERG